MGHWRLLAIKSILNSLNEYQNGLNGDEFNLENAFQKVSQDYPFGRRENYPYSVWRQSVRRAKAFLEGGNDLLDLPYFLSQNKKSSNVKKLKYINKNQLNLF